MGAHREDRPARPKKIDADRLMTWLDVRASIPGIRLWGAFDGSVAYIIAAKVIQDYDYLCPGPFFVSVKRFSIQSDLGGAESLEEAKAMAESFRSGRISREV